MAATAVICHLLRATSERAFGEDKARVISAALQLQGNLACQGKSTKLPIVQAIFHHAGIQPHKDKDSESSSDDDGAGQLVPTEWEVYMAVSDRLSREIGYCPERFLAGISIPCSTMPMSSQVGLRVNGTSFSSRGLSSTRHGLLHEQYNCSVQKKQAQALRRPEPLAKGAHKDLFELHLVELCAYNVELESKKRAHCVGETR